MCAAEGDVSRGRVNLLLAGRGEWLLVAAGMADHGSASNCPGCVTPCTTHSVCG